MKKQKQKDVDLKDIKAENLRLNKELEQKTKELEIEAALEKVRSRSLVMNNSDELKEVVAVLYEQLHAFGLAAWGCSIMIFNKEANRIENWVAESTNSDLNCYYVDGQKHPIYKKLWQNWKKQSPTFTLHHEDEVKREFDEYWLYETGFNALPDAVKSTVLSEREIFLTYATMRHGFLSAAGYQRLPGEKVTILERFAKVFEQTYTRFLDLQKAETQAREAQIQLALEIIRARTMAMQTSNELPEAANLLFQQVQSLGMPAWSAGYCTWDDDKKSSITLSMSSEGVLQPTLSMPLTKDPSLMHFREAWERGESFFIEEVGGEELKKHYTYLRTLPGVKETLNDIEAAGFPVPTFQIFHLAYFSKGFLLFITYEPVPGAHDIFKRFANVFEQTYTRFLDLQKAEAQALEAQIEAALERVRSRTMAMQSSSELGAVAAELFAQMNQLVTNLWTCGFVLCEKNRDEDEWWLSMDGDFTRGFFLPNIGDYAHATLYEGWLKGDALRAVQLDGETLQQHYDWLMEIPVSRAIFEEMDAAGLARPDWQKLHAAYFSKGYLVLITTEPCGKEEIFIRFAQVFDQTYTRFLDLQKAEAQTKEAQIEAALERVRSRSMAMHKSKELRSVVSTLYGELQSLHVNFHVVAIQLIPDNSMDLHLWLGTADGLYDDIIHWPYINIPVFHELYRVRTTGEILEYTISEADTRVFFNEYFKLEGVPQARKMATQNVKLIDITGAFQKLTGIFLMRYTEGSYSPYEKDIVRRFSKAFEQTYTRFLDLQKAEAQAREAQIEAALERVRSRSMAMHKSEELLDVITVVSEQLQQLNFKFNTVSFAINSQQHDYTFWFAIIGEPNPIYIQVPYLKNPMFDRMKHVLAQGLEFHADTLTLEENRAWHEHVFAHAELPSMTEETKAYILNSGYARSIAIKPSIMLIVSNYAGKPYSNDENEIIKRFATVFEQSYTRFLDLKKAEVQVREAQIETALERVRSRTIGMQRSDELQETAALMFQQIESLNVNIMGCGFNIWDDDRKEATAWMSGMDRIQPPFKTSSYRDIFLRIYEAAQKGESLFTEEQAGEELVEHYKYMASIPVFKKILDHLAEKGLSAPSFQIMHCAFFSQGYLMFITHEPSSKAYDIFKRFAKVFEQTYTRFLDLKKAEAQAREAIKQASLDRVRGEIASMRTKDDLDRITPLIWKELIALGVPFIRCGVFIMDEEKRVVHTYLSTPDGKSLSAFEMNFDSQEIAARAVEYWYKKQIYHDFWDKEKFVNFMQTLLNTSRIKTPESYQGSSAPPESLYLNFVPFKQGMLYVGNIAALGQEELALVMSLADSFSIAYARYEDFNKLETAKQQVDKALVDLKQTQQQLVQSEKMASLGELTAGIAHEIQNPLNFVNNFSEVNAELIDEIKVAVQSGNSAEILALADNVKQNLEKISFHGKRADGIVKSMLQHSRTSDQSGKNKKEPTDINVLADEYLRLAYHGLRSKDKTFNATLHTDFDPTLSAEGSAKAGIELIQVIPQDIARAILNLITNAFYAVHEQEKRKREKGEMYSPAVSIVTKRILNNIEIHVKDNGPGIPQHVLEKIFQPFFTTKPTGQGTGLGLSLAYDIVKAHGGDIKVISNQGPPGGTIDVVSNYREPGDLRVEAKEGEGSTFIIQLPNTL